MTIFYSPNYPSFHLYYPMHKIHLKYLSNYRVSPTSIKRKKETTASQKNAIFSSIRTPKTIDLNLFKLQLQESRARGVITSNYEYLNVKYCLDKEIKREGNESVRGEARKHSASSSQRSASLDHSKKKKKKQE